jgi:5-hydroxyisourate hydrolase-like protein (transthyretin family)
MKRVENDAGASLTYKDKTIVLSREGSDIFYRGFFNKEDAEKILREVFNNEIQIDNNYFLELLNHSVSFAGNATIDLAKLTPGKTDKRKLIQKTCDIADDLHEHLDLLLKNYGHETYQHIHIFADYPDSQLQNMEKVDTYEFLSKLKRYAHYLARMKLAAIENLSKEQGKKTGNNTNNSSIQCIYELINVYELATKMKAKDNFKQDVKDKYKGQFYDFVYIVFFIIQTNYKKRYPNTKKRNPFSVALLDTSYALGKLIQRVFSLVDPAS